MAIILEEMRVVKGEGLTKEFGAVSVLAGLDIEIKKGEFVALLGRSGSGKTTLLRVLSGLDRLDSGTLDLPNSTSVVFQDSRLMPWLNAWQNVIIGADHPGSKAKAISLLAEVGLAHRAENWPKTLSGGEAQRVALARALLREPELLLMDEPFAALDALTRLQMHELVTDLCDKHTPAVLLVTHDVDEAILLADRILVLEHGVVKESFGVAIPRPRQPDGLEFLKLRGNLLGSIGVIPGRTVTSCHDEQAPVALKPSVNRRNIIKGVGVLAASAVILPALFKRDPQREVLPKRSVLRVGRYRQGAPDSEFFKQAGVNEFDYDIEYTEIPSSNELLELLVSGSLDVGLSSNIPPVFAKLQNKPVRQIASVETDASQVAVLLPAGSPIRRISELRGKKVGYLSANTQHYMLLKLLKGSGIAWSEINAVALSAADGFASFKRGDLDAWVAAGWVAWQAQEDGATVLANGKGVIDLDLVVLANTSKSGGHRQQNIADYLNKINAVWKWSALNSQEWASRNVAVTGLSMKFYEQLRKPQFSLSPVTERNIQSQQDVANSFADAGLIDRGIDVRPYWDSQYLKI